MILLILLIFCSYSQSIPVIPRGEYNIDKYFNMSARQHYIINSYSLQIKPGFNPSIIQDLDDPNKVIVVWRKRKGIDTMSYDFKTLKQTTYHPLSKDIN